MNIEIYDHLPQGAAWDAIVDPAGTVDYFSSRAWYEVFTRTVVGDAAQVRFLAARDPGGAVAAILPLWAHPAEGVLRARLLGSLTNYYSCLYQPLFAPQRELAERGLKALIDHLISIRPQWSMIDLRPMPSDNWCNAVILEQFRARGFRADTYTAFGNWYLDCTTMDFEQYLATRRKKMRSTVRSKTNQLSKSHQLEYRIVQEAEHVDAAVQAYETVYNLSWKQSEPYPRFIPELAHALAREGKLRLGLLNLDDRTVAAQLWFFSGGTAHIFKLAYDPDFSQFSVGTLLTMKLVEHSMVEDGAAVVDFLSGDDEYKKHWMSDFRERVGIEVINPRSSAGLALLARRALGAVKRRLT